MQYQRNDQDFSRGKFRVRLVGSVIVPSVIVPSVVIFR